MLVVLACNAIKPSTFGGVCNAQSFDVLSGDVNFAIHKETFKDYHLNGLHYANSSKLATIPNGDVGGAGEAIDKVYYVAWSTKETWASKQSEVRALYTS